jgi:hypothetical protein
MDLDRRAVFKVLETVRSDFRQYLRRIDADRGLQAASG